jgi:hypothetical protein
MKQSLAYLGSRILLLLMVMVGLAWIYRQFFWKADLDQYGDQLLEVWAKSDTCDVLYFAESSNATYAVTDSCTKSISELFALHYPDKVIGSINKGATHAGVFLPLINQIPDETKVKTVIVTMNLRSFGEPWINSELETALMKSNVMYAKRIPLMNKLMMSFGYYDHKTKKERDTIVLDHLKYDTLHFPFEYPYHTIRAWDDAFANGYYLLPDGSWDAKKIALACHYIKAYAFQIDTLKNPRIRDFDNLVSLARQKNLQLVFNLLPENMEYADSLVGKPLTFLMRQNRDLLVERYRRMGVIVVDNLESVAGHDFRDQDWTTEHYNYAGRKQIADNLALYVRLP